MCDPLGTSKEEEKSVPACSLIIKRATSQANPQVDFIYENDRSGRKRKVKLKGT
jgi:hypothetical protein